MTIPAMPNAARNRSWLGDTLVILPVQDGRGERSQGFGGLSWAVNWRRLRKTSAYFNWKSNLARTLRKQPQNETAKSAAQADPIPADRGTRCKTALHSRRTDGN